MLCLVIYSNRNFHSSSYNIFVFDFEDKMADQLNEEQIAEFK